MEQLKPPHKRMQLKGCWVFLWRHSVAFTLLKQ